MKRLKNISLFKLITLSLISVFLNNIFVYLIVFIYLFFNKYIEAFIYTLIVLFMLFMAGSKTDFIPVGIIETKKSSYYVVDKILYKTKLINEDELQIGDVLFFEDRFRQNKTDYELNKNINFYGYKYEKLFNFRPRLVIYDRIQSFSNDTSSVLNKFFYNINNYDDLSFNIGYGLIVYYLFKFISKYNENVSIIVLMIYIILFSFQIKFYLIIIDYVLHRFKLNKNDKYAIKLFIVYLINPALFHNYSILIPLLINIYSLIELNISFRMYMSVIESVLFGEINVVSMFIYKYYVYIQLFVLGFSMVLLIFPGLESLFLFVIKLFSFINDLKLCIRGSISVFSIVIYYLIIKLFKIDSQTLKFILILLLIISPYNNPLMHISFIDVGQGDAILIKFALSQANILIDTGSAFNYYKLKTYLFKQGIFKLDYLIITHDDKDHSGNIESLCEDFKVENIIIEGQDISVNNCVLKYYDLGEYDNENDNSLVYSLNVNGYTFLFTGDISYNVERVFIKKYGNIDVDVLKVSHHGSYTATSKYFISNTLPKYAVISTSGQYNHPARLVLDSLDAYFVKYYITKQDSNVEFYFTGLVNFIKSRIANFVIMR